ncbi:uncharacterized protein FIESC28_05538 [Fusarium coffeatum]|uniref:Uncharacterized protein n=1 Tax=Fusarium coffeatum TaxID=231269 RepID=A0A366RR14_9HYPO|nr:uncharacterized protein FIESC28_05538 [Fusarium coffeatum]RBR19543.1 hypothetical protein FIESC28_05538 [Fusarium coffeatum]
MLKLKPSAPGRSHRRRKEGKKATVETDASSEKSRPYSSDSEGSWLDDIGPSESASVVPENPQVSSQRVAHQSHRMEDPSSPNLASNGLGGHPLVHFGGYSGIPQMPPPRRRRSGMHEPTTGNPSMEYPSHRVRYPQAPNMQRNPGPQYSSAPDMQSNPQYPPASNGQGNSDPQAGVNPYGYFGPNYQNVHYNPYANHYPPGMIPGNPYLTFPAAPPAAPPREQSPPPREDPDKIRLEAEIAAFKAMEERAKAAEKQKEREAQIRKEAEEAFHRRMEDMRLAQEEAKKEIEWARLEAQRLARENLETERKAEEMQAKKHAEMMASAEEAAIERLQKEKESEEERAKQLADLEREVRLKLESERRAKLAEQEAKARQNEDLERLAKLKMLQSMDEIVSLTKKKVLHELVMDGDLTGRQDWLIKVQDEIEAGKGQSRNGSSIDGGRTSISKQGLTPRHATASTVRSASSASAKLSTVSPAPPEAPNVPESSDSESAQSRVGTDPLTGRTYPQLHRFGSQRQETHDNDLVGQIADAVIERLMSSPYYDVSIRHRQQADRYYSTNSFTPASNPFEGGSRFGNQESFGYGPPPCGPMRRFYVPPKPDHLRGRSLKEPGRSPSFSPPAQQDVPVSRGGSRLSTIHSAPSPPPLEEWLDSTQAATSYSEVETVTQEPPGIRMGYVGAEEVLPGHSNAWFEESLHRMEKVNASVYVTEQGVEHGFR